MNILRLIFILAYLSTYLIAGEPSTRERIEYHKAWLERRAAIKRNHLQSHYTVSNSSTSYYKKYLLLPANYRKAQKSKHNLSLDSDNNSMKSSIYFNKQRLKERKKQKHLLNDVLPLDNNEDVTKMAATVQVPITTPIEITMQSQNNDETNNRLITKTTSTTTTETPIAVTSVQNATEINNHRDLATAIATTTPKPMNSVTSVSIPIRTNKQNDVVKVTIENAIHVANETQTKASRNPKNKAAWGRWHPWTTCSRSCGGGVMSQSRLCLSRVPSTSNNRTSNECIGLYKRYRICNEQSCPEQEIDFREQQCIQYNDKVFRGKTYSWEAYVIENAECELNCKPIGVNYFATLNETVIDGTTCYMPVDSKKQIKSGRSMCVEGVCKVIHSNGILTGAFMNNGAVRCGSSVCRPVSNVFTKNPLPNGYVHIATIPIGASNISILELKNSENFLVLKQADQTFIINGEHIISDGGVYNAAGTIFDYRRIDGAIESSNEEGEGVTEWITASGPTTEPIYLMILSQEKNPGIKYEYLLPINAAQIKTSSEENNSVEMEADMPPSAGTATESESMAKENTKSSAENTVKPNGDRRKRKYLWKVVSFSSCSKSCGGGILTPLIRCIREGTSKFFNHKRCAHHSKPVLNEAVLRCNLQPCPAYWKIDEWSACNCGLPNEHEHQTREIKCVQELGTGVVIQVIAEACLEAEPSKQQYCDCPKKSIGNYRNGHKRNHHEHHTNSHHSAGGSFRAPITLIGNSTIGKRVHLLENKKAGVWLSTDWNQQCSTKCGDGIQYRSIFCDRTAPTSERCDLRLTPDITRQCTAAARCNVGEWFIGPWSDCFGDCFSLTRSRSVLCIKNEQIVSDSECIDSNNVDNSTKPDLMEECELSSVSYCKPRWHYSEWTDCTKHCGSGTQRRTVKCLEPNLKDTQMKETDNCRYSERPQAFRSCNSHKCDNESSSEEEKPAPKIRAEPKVELVQNDSSPVCVDKFPNCHIVIRAQLCTYEYYIKHCCATCKEAVAQRY